MSTYSRTNPSLRYLELLGYYETMHNNGWADEGIPAEKTFPGSSLKTHMEKIRDLITKHEAKTVLDYGSGKGQLYSAQNIHGDDGTIYSDMKSFMNVNSISCYDPAYKPFKELPAGKFDAVISTDVVEHCPKDDLPWIINEIFEFASKFVFINAACYPALKQLPNGENAHCTVEPPEWWSLQLHTTAQHHPGISCYGCYGVTHKARDGQQEVKYLLEPVTLTEHSV